ncbi:MAG TPA: glycosyl hydrolase [Saprospiraceae bacterium]|nr:glycosyl hydrolase [Saprospiraceae bacterium]HPI06949.1 glycosyl hydrolase [Saprospiraceae bacterium]
MKKRSGPTVCRKQIFLFSLLAALVFCQTFLFAQPGPTPAEARLQGFEQRKNLGKASLLSVLAPESIGPSIFSCRVTDVDVDPSNPSRLYAAYASGGLWYSDNNATTFKPVFDHEASMTIGDIAVDWQHNIIWVGTGEANSSRSSYAGTGIYKSNDRGKHWTWCGLPESHHISRIILHPVDTNIVWVAVLGHLYSGNPERGIYKTTDGGKTWNKTLFINDLTGAIDLVPDPRDPNTLFAATWERKRSAWNFDGAGTGSGIWKSTDAGETWSLVSTPESGFPSGPKTGRIGLAAGQKNGKTVLYACVDNQNAKPKKETIDTEALTQDQLRTISKEDFLKIGDEKLAEFLKKNGFPEKYDAKKVKSMVKSDKIKPGALVEYLEDANASLFETDFIGAEVYRSDDGGLTWKRTHKESIEQMHFTYGYYFSNIRCMPDDADQVYLIGFLIIRSEDGGDTWKNINGDNVHVDHHALWLDPARPGYLVNGNDGGLNISWDNGTSWIKCNNPPVGQFYAISVDQDEPYNVYGGTQDNGVWTGPSNFEASDAWHQTGNYPYKSLLGGDGMQVQVDYRDNNTVYSGFQFGYYYRINKLTGRSKAITPQHDLGERPLRFNWQTPIHLSRHQQDVLYFGANKLYRSFDKGDNWEVISGDLTTGGKPGNVPYGTLTTIHESPLKFGLLYSGSDDGLIHVTRDGGETWNRISDSLPQHLWVSRVQASAHERGRVFASLNGYRLDDFNAYVYVSHDYGQHWNRIGTALPAEPVNVIREDPVNENVLYVGTDHNLYVSLDRGQTFQTLHPDYPHTPVHDLVVQPQTHDLLIGTHGRSIYKVNMSNVEKMTDEVLASALFLFEIPKKRFSKNWGKQEPYKEIKDPELPVTFYAASVGSVKWKVQLKNTDVILNSGVLNCNKGLNEFVYNLEILPSAVKKYREALLNTKKDDKKPPETVKADSGKYYLNKGSYTFTLEKDGVSVSADLVIE